MADRLTPLKRSALMAKIKSKDTGPELRVRRVAHALGYRFRLHRKDLPGRPDLVFPRLRKAIMVHGCFWHRHPGCKQASKPKSRVDFWQAKFLRNMARDADALMALEILGWDVLVVWECETEGVAGKGLEERVRGFLGGGRHRDDFDIAG